MVDVDTKPYYEAGRSCRELAGHVSAQLGLLRVKLNSCGSMAGDYPSVAGWAQSYDTKTSDFVKNAEEVVNALENFGDVVNVAGYNWDVANYNANSSSDKGAPPVCPARSRGPLYEGAPLIPPSASGSNGDGLDTDVPGLLEKIGVPIPDGDTDKLSHAASAWSSFSSHESISGANTSIQSIHDGFVNVTTDDATHIQTHLATLKGAVTSLSNYSTAMASPVGAHENALTDLRSGINTISKELVLALGAVAVAFVASIAVTALSGGLAAGAAVGTAEGAAALIARAAISIKNLITGSRLIVGVLAVGGAVATAEFGKVDGLTAAGVLSHIAMMTAQTIDDDGPKYVPSPKHDTSMPDHGRQGTPMDLSEEEAQEVLDRSIESGGK